MRVLVIVASIGIIALGVTFPAASKDSNERQRAVYRGHTAQHWHAKWRRARTFAVRYRTQRDDVQTRLARRVREVRRLERQLARQSRALASVRRAESAEQARYARADRDFTVALRWAADTFGVSYRWLHNCAASEGGFHAWIPNRGGSGAGGWMQFMSGTFYGYVDSALAAARARGVRTLASWRSWYSRPGQAFTAAYMFSRGLSWHWAGRGC